MNFIKSLIKKPDEILYDGYLCNRKKPSINYLLNKTKTKENSKFLEENILFKKPYPLIRYLSNRKIPNKSRQLITDILSAELNNSFYYKTQKPPIKYIIYKKRNHKKNKKGKCHYDPEHFPALTYKMNEQKISFSIFSSGKIILRGSTEDAIIKAFNNILPLFKQLKKKE